jgi:hypothetical protein
VNLLQRFEWEEELVAQTASLNHAQFGNTDLCAAGCHGAAKAYVRNNKTFYLCATHRFTSTWDKARVKLIEALIGLDSRVRKLSKRWHITAYHAWIAYGISFFCLNYEVGLSTALKHPNSNSFYISYGTALFILFFALRQARKARLKVIEQKLDKIGK